MKRSSEETTINDHHHQQSASSASFKKLKSINDSIDSVEQDDDLAKFQKKAIYIQLQEYKRLWNDQLEVSTEASLQVTLLKSVVEKFLSTWKMMEAGLQCTDSGLEKLVFSDNAPTAIDQAWGSISKAIFSKVAGASKDALESATLKKVADLESKLAMEKDSSKILKELVETKDRQLQSHSKKLDRLRLLKTPDPATIPTPATEPAKLKKEDSVETKIDSVELEKYNEIAALAETRLSQIDSLTKEKYTLEKKLDERDIQLAQERAGRDVEKTMRYQLGLQDAMKADLEKALRQVESLQTTRRQYLEQITNEEEKRRKAMESDIKQYEQDLTRIRSHRDSLQKTLDLVQAQATTQKSSLEEIKTLAEARKDRIESLVSELRRIKTEVASNGNTELALVRFFGHQDGDPYAALLEKLQESSHQITVLEARLSTDNDGESNLQKHIEKAQSLEKTISKYEALFGKLEDEKSDTILLLQEKEKQLKESTLKLEAYKMTENMLKNELETLGKAWSKLEEQNSRKVLNLIEKEDAISRLTGEKIRLEQKISTLSKQATTLTNNQVAQKRQTEKQLEQIRKLEELEKSLTQQLQTCEKQIAAARPALLQEQQLLKQKELELAQFSDQIQGLNARCETVNILLLEKSDQMEMEKEITRKAVESSNVLRKKYDAYMKNNGDSGNSEEYRLLLMCQSCNNNFKSHVLLKCMHTFCKGCIDDMYNSRQRKCPTCAIPFGQQDIKQVYL